jgi:uncharacterized membrane protein
MLVHFPIALLVAAVGTDLLALLLAKQTWLRPMAASLYATGAVAAGVAYVTGLRAAAEVFVPGMAHPIVAEHRTWALATTVGAGAMTAARLALQRTSSKTHVRIGLVLAGLVLLLLVQQTAERGARLVYEQGVGVIAAP